MPAEQNGHGVEHERLAFDRERAEQELELKKRELQLRESELKRSRWSNPLVLVILTAALGIAGNGIVAWYNGRSSYELEERRAEQSRVLEAIKTADPDKAATNLEFLLQTGLYTDKGGRLKAYLDRRKPGSGPALPSGAVQYQTGPNPFSSAFGVQFGSGTLQYMIVIFPETRSVLASGRAVGSTNEIIALPGGRYTITLEGSGFVPSAAEVALVDTTEKDPAVITFAAKK
jgi:hypothetical protein